MGIKDMFGIDAIVDQKVAVMKDDLYKSIKDVSELKYRLLEAETKLNNLELAIKAFHPRGL